MRYNRIKTLTATAAAALAGIAVTSAQAQFIAVANQSTSRTEFMAVTSPPSWTSLASPFTTGSGSGWSLSSATFDLTLGTVNSFSAFIYANTIDDKPGSELATASLANVPQAGRSDVTFDFSSSGLTLSPSTPYWLAIVQTTGGKGDSGWAHPTGSYSTSGLPGWSIGSTMLSGPSWVGVLGEPGLFSITVVPEPSTYALISGMGLAAFAGYRRWRNGA